MSLRLCLVCSCLRWGPGCDASLMRLPKSHCALRYRFCEVLWPVMFGMGSCLVWFVGNLSPAGFAVRQIMIGVYFGTALTLYSFS